MCWNTALSLASCAVQVVVKWLGLSLACAEYAPWCTRLCGWASAEAVGGWVGGGWREGWALISVHARTSPARSHLQLLYFRKGAGNHFRRCRFYQKPLSTKLTLVKHSEKKMTSRQSRATEQNPGRVDKELGDGLEAQDPVRLRECQMII